LRATFLAWEAGADIVGVVCAIWRGEGEPRIEALPGVTVAAAMTKADLGG
jgi:orotate phosphoribosyltransferase